MKTWKQLEILWKNWKYFFDKPLFYIEKSETPNTEFVLKSKFQEFAIFVDKSECDFKIYQMLLSYLVWIYFPVISNGNVGSYVLYYQLLYLLLLNTLAVFL